MSGPYGPGCDEVLLAQRRFWEGYVRKLSLFYLACALLLAALAFGAGLLVGAEWL